MLLDLVCFGCVMEQVNKGVPNQNIGEPILTPFEEVNNTGIYKTRCGKGHDSTVVIDNIDFEILFEYGINAIADGYFREAVSSMTSAMERYFEFFIKVILKSSKNTFVIVDEIWKSISSQSERQLGAYLALYCHTFKELPLLLNPNKEIPFRNSVIHKGYIPSKTEAITYGNLVMQIIENSLIKLKNKNPKITNEIFDYYGYKRSAKLLIGQSNKKTENDQYLGFVNIMTTIDVKHGRELHKDDGRKGKIEDRIPNILERRNPRNLSLLKERPSIIK